MINYPSQLREELANSRYEPIRIGYPSPVPLPARLFLSPIFHKGAHSGLSFTKGNRMVSNRLACTIYKIYSTLQRESGKSLIGRILFRKFSGQATKIALIIYNQTEISDFVHSLQTSSEVRTIPLPLKSHPIPVFVGLMTEADDKVQGRLYRAAVPYRPVDTLHHVKTPVVQEAHHLQRFSQYEPLPFKNYETTILRVLV